MSLSLFQEALRTALYSESSIPGVCLNFAAFLQQSQDINDLAHASKLIEYRTMISDRKYQSKIQKLFTEIFNLIKRKMPSIHFVIEGRQKSLISLEKKIQRLLNEQQSLDMIRDIFAFRIIIFGELSQEDLIFYCYKVAKLVIVHSVESGLILCSANPKLDTAGFVPAEHKGIIIPKPILPEEEYLTNIKDYISEPKQNGYQSLHFVLRDSQGRPYEVQIRTLKMHGHAVNGDAEHSKYKSMKYHQDILFDRELIHIPGYELTPKGKIIDLVGLEKEVPLLRRQKTY